MDLHGVTWKLYGTDSTAEASWRLTAGKPASQKFSSAAGCSMVGPPRSNDITVSLFKYHIII